MAIDEPYQSIAVPQTKMMLGVEHPGHLLLELLRVLTRQFLVCMINL